MFPICFIYLYSPVVLQKYHSNKTFNLRHIKGFEKESKKTADLYIDITEKYQIKYWLKVIT